MKRWLAFGALLAVVACSDKTALLVEVRSGRAVPGEVNALRFTVTAETSGAMLDESLPIDGAFPHTYTVLPGRSRANEAVSIRVQALIDGRLVVERTVASRFEQGRTVRVIVELDDAMPMDAGPRDAGPGDAGADAGCSSPLECDDGVACTTDVCGVDGVCTNTPDNSFCADGATCDPVTGCPGRPCVDAAECDNGDYCDGAEVCFEMLCGRGSPVTCDDGVDCTTDLCDETVDACQSTPVDAACADTDLCNGTEVCDPVMDCQPAPVPLSCDDSDPCTDDVCDAMGGCSHATRDADMDGHGDVTCPATGAVLADDCNDMNASVLPGAPEDCNGTDDNCDGACDEGFTCCAGETGSCTTSCGSTGMRVCGATCGWGICAAPPEICNGVDDDCNGECDEGSGCCAGSTVACTTSCGTAGTRACDGACVLGACTPPSETCDGRDQDCDMRIDEGCGAACVDDAECDDGIFCNGVETCVLRGCTPGTRPDCDDGILCTVDSCDTTTDACVRTPDDRFCDDLNFCNGDETCDRLAGCRVGAAPTCDDMSDCTEDACVGTMPGACVRTTRDVDDDGFGDRTCPPSGGVTNDDCDDTRATVYPGAPEICNGRDDDCDGMTDDGYTCARGASGACTTTCGTAGSRICNATCAWDACSPPAETCNGMDDDCNAVCDDGFACCSGATGSCTTACGTTGSRTCSASCGWGMCTPPAETCNGRDDDCDGMLDETFACVQGTSASCTTTCGSTGTRTCSATCTMGTCAPPAEACNGADDDCDTRIDESVECSMGAMGPCTTSCGSTGSRTCGAMCTWGTCTPPAETCNGADDDCDTMIDDGFTCAAGAMGSCMTSCMSTGTRTCSGTCTWGTCNPPVEICNGADDDCDAMADDGFTCVRGSTGSCTTSCMSTGSRTCSASCTWGTCSPPSESCNGADDDCDASVDESFTCVRGASGSCTTTCGSAGTRMCGASCTWGTCMPPAETCNGLDDDCDGMIDDSFTCAVGSTGSCTTSCMTTGTRTCSASCAWSACSPPAETCNGIDDDCNSVCDDGFSCCRGTTSSCTTTCGTTGSRVCQSDCSAGTCTPPAEACNGADDDCDTMPDDGFACVQGAMSTCTTTCGSTGTQTCGPTCMPGVCAPPPEICNGVDDDCDGMTDEGCGGCLSCTGATAVSATGGRYTVTLGAHVQTGSCSATMGSEAYLTFTLTAASDVFIATHGAAVDTVVYVRECTCTGTETGCNDNSDGLTTSRLQLNALAAGTYNIIVDTKAAMSGSVPVDVYISPADVDGDQCGRATFIAAGTTNVTGNTCTFGNEYDVVNVTGDCQFLPAGDAVDRVYAFYVPTARTVTFSGCNGTTAYDSVIYTRRICNDAGASAQVACNDDGCSGSPSSCSGGLRSSRSFTLMPGLHYFFVDGYDNGAWPCPCGNYRFDITGL